MKKLLAYPHGNKSMYLARVRAHQQADELVSGIGWDGKKGCAVGCTLHSYDHARYEPLLGVPETLARWKSVV